MTTATRTALRALRARHGVGAIVALLLVVGLGFAAFAYWTASGTGSGTATAATLSAPTGVTATSSLSTVTVGFTGVTPPGGTLTGYYVTRYAGATASNACGTTPGVTASYLAAAAAGCSDTSVPDGTYTYKVTAVFRTWTAQSTASSSVTVVGDLTAPTQSVTLTSPGGTAYLVGSTVYYRSTASGSFTLSSAVTDTGSGPKQAVFPAIGTTGWTHGAETVTTGTGSAPTITYTSTTFSWTASPTVPGSYTVTASDVTGNTSGATLTFAPDVTGPTGGALVVGGVTATAGGATAYSTSGTFTGTRTDFSADAGSGVTTSVLTREVGTLSNGACSAYAAPTTVVGAPNETTVATGCYRYTLTGTDRVGNTSTLTTVVQADRTAPTQAVTATGANASMTGSTLYYKGDAAGSFTLSDAVTDADSGPKQALFPAIATTGWTHAAETVTTGTGAVPTITYPSSTFSWTANPTNPTGYSVTGSNLATGTVATALTFVSDVTVPTTGALTVNGTGAIVGGTTSYSTTGSYALARTDFTDAGSGIATSTLTREAGTLSNGACSGYAAPATVAGAPSETTLATGCYRYVLTGTDKVGNSIALTTVVLVDRTAPSQALSETGTNSYLSGGTLWFKGNTAGSFTLSTAVTDGASGPKQVLYPAIATAGWTHNAETVTTGTGSAPTVTYTSTTFSWAASPTTPGSYSVTGSDLSGGTVATAVVFASDTTVPTTGALTVNGTGAIVGGTTSTSATGSYALARTDFTDAGSGIASSTLTREVGTLSNGACSAYASPTTVVGAPSEAGLASGCYRYVLTGTDNVGNFVALTTVVQVDSSAPTQVLTEAGANSHYSGGTLYYRGNVAGSFTLTDAVTDNETSPKQAVFPAIATAGWTHGAETVTTGTGAAPTISYTSSTFSWTASPTNPSGYTVTGSNLGGTAVATGVSFVSDVSAPVTGDLSANSVTASAGGTTSVSSTGTFTGARTDFTDASSGIASSTLTREVGTLLNGACSGYASPTTVVGAPSETGVASGCYRYVLTGVDNVGNTASVTTVVQVDRTTPTQVVTENGADAFLSGGTLYYRSGVAGSLTLTSAVTDAVSGPGSATFPAIGTAGWTHNAETVSTGTGAVPTISYTSTAFSWTASPTNPGSYTVTASSAAGGTSGTALAFTADATAPTGGALTVNGVTATAGGAVGYDLNGTYTGTRTNYSADTGSGLASSVLTREAGTLLNGGCTGYAAPTTIATTPNETTLANGCYRYTLTGTDNVGNTSSLSIEIQVDKTAPTQAFSATGNGYATGTTLYYRNSGGSLVLSSAVTDPLSGPASALFANVTAAGWTHAADTQTTGTGAPPTTTYSSTYTWTNNPNAPNGGSRTVTASDLAGNALATQLTFTSDNSSPTGGALNVNSTAGSLAGSTSYSTTGTFTGTRTHYSADTGSGLDTSVLTREVGTLSGGTCTGYGAPTVLAGTPSETALADGCYRYTLTGTDRVDNVSSLTTTVLVDRSAPTQVLTETGGPGFLSGSTVYYRGNLAGSFTLTAAVTDDETGPKQAVFPAIATTGWTHANQTVTTGTGAVPTIAYTSTSFSWTANPTNPTGYTVTGSDQAGNTVATALTFVSDTTAPTSGALDVNSTSASAVGTSSGSSTGTFAGTRTDFTDAGSGIASSTLTREVGTLSGGACTAYAPPTTVAGSPNESSVATGCYRYVLTGTDNVGVSTSLTTVVKVDRSAPTQAITENGANTYLSGGTLYYRGGSAGSFTLTSAVTDNVGGPASATFPVIGTTGWTHNAETVSSGTGAIPTISYTSSTFSWTASPTNPSPYTVTGEDAGGNTVGTALTFVSDATGPTGGALAVGGVSATAGGASGYSTTGTFTGTRTNFAADAGSGLASSVLTREAGTLSNGVCSGYAAPTTVATTPSETTLATGCYRYVLTGTDNVGNTSTLTAVVMVDRSAPTQTFTETGANAAITGTTLYYKGDAPGSFTLGAVVTDGESGPLQASFPAIATAGWTHNAEVSAGGTGSIPTITFPSSTYSWTASPTNPTTPAARTVTSSDAAGNTVATALTFVSDTTVPTTGALTVNGTGAVVGGTSSFSATGTFTGTRTDFTDAGSGIASSVLTREVGSLTGAVCGGYAAPTTVVGAPSETTLAAGCYRYVLTGTDRVGNTVSLTTVVVVDSSPPTQAVTLSGGAGSALLTGSTVYYRPTAAGSFTLNDAVTDAGSGPKQALFPAIGTAGWTHATETVTTGTGSAPTITYPSNTFSWTASPSNPAAYTVTGSNNAGATVGTALTFTPDSTGPTGGALAVNGTTGTAGTATSWSRTGTYTGTFTSFGADTGSGFLSSTLTRNVATTLSNGVCSGWGTTPTTIASISESSAAASCYRYTLTGTDKVGNTSVLTVEVQVDKTAPTQVLSATGNGFVSGGVLYYRGGVAGSFTLTSTVTDSGAGPASAAFPAIATAGWTHGAETVSVGTGAIPTIGYASSTYSWTATPTNPAGHTITGSDLAGNTVTSTPTFTSDTTAPTGGALTVNAVAATAGGSTSSTNAVSWTIGTRTDYNADVGSGFDTSVLTREAALWNGTTCAAFGAPTVVTGSPAQTGLPGGYCYRYTLTGTDHVGNTATLTTTVRTGIVVTSVALNNGPNDDGTLNQGDTIVVQYSGPLAVNTLCSTWSGNTTNQTVTGNSVVGVTIREGTGGANDNIQLSTTAAACGGDFNFGVLTLGDDGYLVSTTIQTFRGTGANQSTIAYNASTYTLTVTLGINETTPGVDGSNNVAGNTVATYAPDAAITGAGGVAITGNGTTASVRQF